MRPEKSRLDPHKAYVLVAPINLDDRNSANIDLFADLSSELHRSSFGKCIDCRVHAHIADERDVGVFVQVIDDSLGIALSHKRCTVQTCQRRYTPS